MGSCHLARRRRLSLSLRLRLSLKTKEPMGTTSECHSGSASWTWKDCTLESTILSAILCQTTQSWVQSQRQVPPIVLTLPCGLLSRILFCSSPKTCKNAPLQPYLISASQEFSIPQFLNPTDGTPDLGPQGSPRGAPGLTKALGGPKHPPKR